MGTNNSENDFGYSLNLDSDTVILKGSINDKFQLELPEFLDKKTIHLDFANIRIINSSGILKFIRFLQGLPEAQRVSYHNVPAAIINQMSLVNGIIGPRFSVLTFYVPYTPKDSDEQTMILITIDEVRATGRLPAKKHPETNALLIPDVNETKFLNFLKF